MHVPSRSCQSVSVRLFSEIVLKHHQTITLPPLCVAIKFFYESSIFWQTGCLYQKIPLLIHPLWNIFPEFERIIQGRLSKPEKFEFFSLFFERNIFRAQTFLIFHSFETCFMSAPEKQLWWKPLIVFFLVSVVLLCLWSRLFPSVSFWW